MKLLVITLFALSSSWAVAHENQNLIDNLRDRIGDKRQEIRYDKKELRQLAQALKKETDLADTKLIGKQIVKVSRELTKDKLKLDQMQDRLKRVRHHRRHR